MKKRLITVLFCAVLGFSMLGLTGCGGSDKEAAPAQEETTEESKSEESEAAESTTTDDVKAAADEAAEQVSDDDAVTDETWESLQDLYATLTESYNATVELYNDDSVAADQDIEDALNQAKDLMTQLGDIDRSQVKESDAEDYVEAMTAINDIFSAVIDNVQPADDGSADTSFNECYAGLTDDENTYVYLGFSDGDQGALMFYDESTNESGSFVGEASVDDNGLISIYDESLDAKITFSAEEVDGGYVLDMGDDLGKAYVGEVTPDQFMEAMTAISEGSEPQF